MRSIFLVVCILSLPFFGVAQSKRKMKKIAAQVEQAKAQQAVAIAQKNNKPATIEGASLPSFRLIDMQGQSFTETDIPQGKPILLTLFNPMCDHCQKVAMTLRDSIDKFNNVVILFVTGLNLLNELPNFSQSSGLDGIKNFILCGAQEDFTKQIFLSKGIPQMMLYNKDHLLQKVFFEIINVDSTLHYLNK